jgi:hypothetical protein
VRKNIAEGAMALGANLPELRPGEERQQRSMALALAQRCKLLGICYRKGLNQQRIYKAENGGVRADSEGQCENGGDGKAGRPAQLTKGKTKILKQGPHGNLRAQ